MALTLKQQAFVAAYLANGFNATQAAITAGYSAKTAASQGARLLTNVEVAAALSEETGARWKRLHMDGDEFLGRLANVARGVVPLHHTTAGDPFVDLADLTPDEMEAIAEVEVHDYIDGRGEDARDVRKVKVKMHNKVTALGMIGKNLGLLTERVQHGLSEDFAEVLAEAQRRVADRR